MPALDLGTVLHQTQNCVGQCLSNWKIGFAALLFVEGLVFGHVVYLIKRLTASSSAKFSYVFHLGHALSGGVFFAAGVLHILPEAIALISGEHSGHGEDHDGEHDGDHDGDHDDDHDEDHEGDEDHDERWMVVREEDGDEHDHDGESDEGHSGQFPWAFLILMLSFYVLFFVEKIIVPKLLAIRNAKISPSQSDEEAGEELGIVDSNAIEIDQSPKVTAAKGIRSPEFVTGLIEILGISAHSLFESIALGLSGSFSAVLNIFIATVTHRWATASAIGFKFLRSLNYLSFLVLLMLFSAIVPLGVGIGAALGNLSQEIQGVLFSVSAGTFIYIGVYETLAEEFVENRQWPFTKFIMTLVGASIIVVVTVILHVFDIHG